MIVLLIQVLISIVTICLGFFLFFKPAVAIELQRRFCEDINWRRGPVSMTKEIRNTKVMGLLLVAVGSAGFLFICCRLLIRFSRV